jgi:hypothetical protein
MKKSSEDETEPMHGNENTSQIVKFLKEIPAVGCLLLFVIGLISSNYTVRGVQSNGLAEASVPLALFGIAMYWLSLSLLVFAIGFNLKLFRRIPHPLGRSIAGSALLGSGAPMVFFPSLWLSVLQEDYAGRCYPACEPFVQSSFVATTVLSLAIVGGLIMGIIGGLLLWRADSGP